jgi:chemotaxis-related protein WspB
VLFLLFRLGTDRYALDATQVAEVLPLVAVTRLPQAPPAVAGIFNYRGAPVPAIDLSQLALGRAALRSLSTRIILVRFPGDAGVTYPLGLIAERATETLRRKPADFVASGVSNAAARYLGPVAMDEHGPVQRIELGELLPPTLRELLFLQRVEP